MCGKRKRNNKLSNREYEEKRDLEGCGYEYSKMDINQHLAKNEHFYKKEMDDWGLYLFKKALNIWSFDKDLKQTKLI